MTFRNKLVFGIGLALVFLFIINALSFSSFTCTKAEADWVTHTHVVLEKLADLRTAVVAAETAQRGLILTGEESYLRSREKRSLRCGDRGSSSTRVASAGGWRH